jgi:hypothetical protein
MWELAKVMKITRGQEVGLNKALVCSFGDFGIVEWKYWETYLGQRPSLLGISRLWIVHYYRT